MYEHCEYCGTSLARVGLDTRRSCDRCSPPPPSPSSTPRSRPLETISSARSRPRRCGRLRPYPRRTNRRTPTPSAPASLAEHRRSPPSSTASFSPTTSSAISPRSSIFEDPDDVHGIHPRSRHRRPPRRSHRRRRRVAAGPPARPEARARAYLDVTVPFFARAFARLIGDSSDFRFAASDLARDAFTDVASSA